jgi:hypothetical protein
MDVTQKQIDILKREIAHVEGPDRLLAIADEVIE